MGMNHREWEGMGLKKTFPLISTQGRQKFMGWIYFSSKCTARGRECTPVGGEESHYLLGEGGCSV